MKYGWTVKTGDGDAPGHSNPNTIMAYTEPRLEDLTDRIEQTQFRRLVIAPTAWRVESNEAR